MDGARILRLRRPACRLGHRKAAGLALKHVQVFGEGTPGLMQQGHWPPADGQTFLISGVSVIALDLRPFRSHAFLSTTARSALRKIKQAEMSSDRTSPGLASVTMRLTTIGHR